MIFPINNFRKQRKAPQIESSPMSTTAYGQNNNRDPEPPVSSFPEDLYSQPSACPTSQVQTNQETGNVYHSASQIQKKKPKTIQSYEYADATINSHNTAVTTHIDHGEPNEAGWADNSIYARTGETSAEDGEGWKGNEIYVTSNQEGGEEGWKDNNIYVTSDH